MAEPGRITVTRPRRAFVKTEFKGYITTELVDQAANQLKAAIKGEPVQAALFDASGVSGYDPMLVAAGNRLLKVVKDAAVPRTAAVASSTAVRMMGSAIAFGLGLRMRFFETEKEALAYLESAFA